MGNSSDFSLPFILTVSLTSLSKFKKNLLDQWLYEAKGGGGIAERLEGTLRVIKMFLDLIVVFTEQHTENGYILLYADYTSM